MMIIKRRCKQFGKYLRHVQRMIKELFGGSLPVFVAAAISRASMSLIELVSGDDAVATALTFVYAFFILQALGIGLILRYDHDKVLFPYFLHVVSETTGFAYKEFVVLIMLKWLFMHKLVAAAWASWLCILFIAFLMVYLFNASLVLYFKPEKRTFETLRNFNTAAIALPIAFSFTLIIASIVYPADSASDLAGDNSDYGIDLEDEAGEGTGYFFLLYAFLVTLLIAVLTWNLAPFIRSDDGDASPRSVGFGGAEGDVVLTGTSNASPGSIASIHEQALRASEAHHEHFWKSIDSMDPDSGDIPGPGTSGNTSTTGQGIIQTSDGPIIKPTHSVATTGKGNDDTFSALNIFWSYIDNAVFAWDVHGYCKESLAHLANTSGGYIVGCAWYTFMMLTFQNIFYFVHYGKLLGLFLYACFVTAITVAIMERIENSQVRKWERRLVRNAMGIDGSSGAPDELNKFHSRYKRNTELVRVAGRLLCGWSWADFVVACATSVTGDGTSAHEMTTYHSSNWLRALIKFVLAILIFAMGAWKFKQRQEEEAEESFTRGSSISSSSRTRSVGLSMADQSEKISTLQADFAAEFSSDEEDVEEHTGYNAPLLS